MIVPQRGIEDRLRRRNESVRCGREYAKFLNSVGTGLRNPTLFSFKEFLNAPATIQTDNSELVSVERCGQILQFSGNALPTQGPGRDAAHLAHQTTPQHRNRFAYSLAQSCALIESTTAQDHWQALFRPRCPRRRLLRS